MNIATIGIIAGLFSYGMIVDEIVKRGHYRISVPEFSDHVDVHGNEMAGKLLIKRLKDKNVFGPDMQFEGVIRRGETWNNSRRKEAETEMMQDLGMIAFE